MSDRPVFVLIAFVIAIAIFVWWLGGIVGSWPERDRPRRRITDRRRTLPTETVPAPRSKSSVERLAELNARSIGGIPIWQIRELFEFTDTSLNTHADVSRRLLILAGIEKRAREVRRLLETKREELRLYGERESDPIPDFLRSNGDDVA